MIATPEQYRTLADLIERQEVVGFIMHGRQMVVVSQQMFSGGERETSVMIMCDGLIRPFVVKESP